MACSASLPDRIHLGLLNSSRPLAYLSSQAHTPSSLTAGHRRHARLPAAVQRLPGAAALPAAPATAAAHRRCRHGGCSWGCRQRGRYRRGECVPAQRGGHGQHIPGAHDQHEVRGHCSYFVVTFEGGIVHRWCAGAAGVNINSKCCPQGPGNLPAVSLTSSLPPCSLPLTATRPWSSTHPTRPTSSLRPCRGQVRCRLLNPRQRGHCMPEAGQPGVARCVTICAQCRVPLLFVARLERLENTPLCCALLPCRRCCQASGGRPRLHAPRVVSCGCAEINNILLLLVAGFSVVAALALSSQVARSCMRVSL